MPQLTLPTTLVRSSYLAGEAEAATQEELSAGWVEAAADFASFVEGRRTVRELWGVPVTELWFVDGTDHLGTVIIRHRLTAPRRSLWPKSWYEMAGARWGCYVQVPTTASDQEAG